MIAEHRAHIDEQRLLQILAEDAGMTGAENEHLAQCPQCRSAIDSLRADLQILHRSSRKFTPERTRPINLSGAATLTPIGSLPRSWQIAAGAVASLCLALVLWWPSGPLNPNAVPPERGQRAVAVTPDPVMRETRMLAENALPADYQAIVESLDESFDQGFIEFVIPPLDDESLSRTGPYKESPYV